MAFYKSIAVWYDQIFPFIPAQKNFIEIETGGLNGKQIVDIGCGTGKLAVNLSSLGADITGVDLDDEMLDIARKRNAGGKQLAFLNLNMLKIGEYFESNSFDAIISFGNTLVHLQSPGEILSFFNQTGRILSPSGKLLIQIVNYDFIIDTGLNSLPLIENEKISFQRYYEFREQDEKINFKTILTVKKTGQIIKNSVPLLPLRRELLLHLLDKAGFNNITFYGSFDRTKSLNDSFSLIISAQI